MFKKILVANRGVRASARTAEGRQIAVARAACGRCSREVSHV
ncbi:hypothetical protein [Variovorax rhizosphaerae]|uniref:50S ribosomal protein L28 n=1 Tax=Variovorax rhizosphaerae TaxID=1836200 RepID=A0ABU8WGU6_9BURK